MIELLFTKHARQRMLDWNVSSPAIRRVIENGVIIERYPHDSPYPSVLMLGWDERNPIHLVAAAKNESTWIVITVYVPSREKWENDFRTRSGR
jgi:hypothetical protein